MDKVNVQCITTGIQHSILRIDSRGSPFISAARLRGGVRTDKPGAIFELWRTRRDSNSRPLPSEGV